MTTTRRFAGILAAGTAMALALTACAGGGGSPQQTGTDGTPQTGGTVHMLQNADFSYLDPARGWDGGVNAFYRLLYRGLTMQAAGDSDDPNAIVPDLATGLGEVSDDGLTWTYTLKDDLFFDNGDPITSAEMEFGISRAWDPQIGIGSPYLKSVIDAPADYQGPYVSGDLPTIETPDAKTIVFHLKAPFPEFDNVLAQPNAVPFPIGSGGGDEFINDVIASGPYTLDSYTPGSTIKLVRNEHWEPETDEVRKAYPDQWQFDIGIDGATIDERMIAGQGADQNAIAGKIAGATLPRIQTPQLQERAITAPAYCTTYMSLNTTKPPFDDLRVRQAVNWALDRASIQNASGGNQLADVATTIIPPAVSGHLDYDLYPSDGNTGDVDEAMALLAEAGLGDGFEFTLDIRSNPVAQAQAEAVQQGLERIGATVKLNVIDTSIYYETIATPSQQNNAAITGWCPDWASSASTFIPPLFDGAAITEKGNQNLAQLNDPAVNERIAEIRGMTDVDAANEAWGELDQQIMELAPIAPMVFENGIFLPGSNIAGYIPNTNMTDLTIVGLKDPSKG
ncbi:peptide ABC transporter substrate-binding protein [Microbacterium arborescens]|jgi:peptide/nickel transport system substrate-binding protein|uniref:Peptide/nickel transport system substrate-binding protein n=2 Tax=Microbacterium TaxID=33882 RepID=A0ABU1I224_9MICO|nr:MULTISPECIES: ABC transporter substrate-binding protein [Microbacterium]MDR6167701.1 peptide/nickel transport system substrate-binding protein [Microbacterium paludicola]OAZ42312.1 peptide ABC transporter substrate-binding protein [Microbacterium arborescens]POX66182.1 peptide ABC transporter substrate-binding protein [Microbacterium sp. Ru50]